jgi:hypothetical protein
MPKDGLYLLTAERLEPLGDGNRRMAGASAGGKGVGHLRRDYVYLGGRYAGLPRKAVDDMPQVIVIGWLCPVEPEDYLVRESE